jgi:hypothetical protein
MKRPKTVALFALVFSSLLLLAKTAHATDISGTISSTLTITENSKLVGDVTCTVMGAACITFGVSGLTLDLNGYNMVGLGDSVTGCSGSATANEAGILVNMLENVIVRGPGVVTQFRNTGVLLVGAKGATVTGVTASINCLSGILLGGGSSNNLIENNVSIRNGNLTNPCGGI